MDGSSRPEGLAGCYTRSPRPANGPLPAWSRRNTALLVDFPFVGPRVRPKVRAQSKARMKRLYQELMGITRGVLRQADGVLRRHREAAAQLQTTVDLLRRVVAQTRTRVLRGNTRFPGKVVSLFEPHTEIIRKGKLAKPTEFGRVVKIQEAEAQFVTDYEV